MEKNKEKVKIISLSEIRRILSAHKRAYYIALPTTLVLSYLLMMMVPRYYTCEIKLAPEYDTGGTGAMSSLASSFGIKLGAGTNVDAISPTLYPTLIESNDFVVKLFGIRVCTNDSTVKTTYYDYLNHHQKKSLPGRLLGGEEHTGNGAGADPFRLTKEQTKIVRRIQANVKCAVDRKTDVITFDVTDQDPLVAACMADSVRCLLQEFITDYRTNKARTDLRHYEKLTRDAKHTYEKARQLYASYSDENQEVLLKAYQSKTEDLENDMQLKFNVYSTMNNQLEAARAKLQERTPAFTVLQGASVPERPSGPGRVRFALMMTLLVFLCMSLYHLRKDIFEIVA